MGKIFLLLCLIFVLSSCTKSKDPTMLMPEGLVLEHAILPKGPNQDLLILVAKVAVSKKLSKKIGKEDTLFWALSSEKGKRIAHGYTHAVKMPQTISIHAKNLLTPIKKDERFVLSVFIAKPGQEFKPVAKGALMASSADLKKHKKLSVGDRVTLQLSTMRF